MMYSMHFYSAVLKNVLLPFKKSLLYVGYVWERLWLVETQGLERGGQMLYL